MSGKPGKPAEEVDDFAAGWGDDEFGDDPPAAPPMALTRRRMTIRRPASPPAPGETATNRRPELAMAMTRRPLETVATRRPTPTPTPPTPTRRRATRRRRPPPDAEPPKGDPPPADYQASLKDLLAAVEDVKRGQQPPKADPPKADPPPIRRPKAPDMSGFKGDALKAKAREGQGSGPGHRGRARVTRCRARRASRDGASHARHSAGDRRAARSEGGRHHGDRPGGREASGMGGHLADERVPDVARGAAEVPAADGSGDGRPRRPDRSIRPVRRVDHSEESKQRRERRRGWRGRRRPACATGGGGAPGASAQGNQRNREGRHHPGGRVRGRLGQRSGPVSRPGKVDHEHVRFHRECDRGLVLAEAPPPRDAGPDPGAVWGREAHAEERDQDHPVPPVEGFQPGHHPAHRGRHAAGIGLRVRHDHRGDPAVRRLGPDHRPRAGHERRTWCSAT